MTSETLERRTTARKDSIVIFFAAFTLGLLLSWDGLFDAYHFHDNWRQVPHWTSPETQQFQPDDIILRYTTFNTSQFANFLYMNLAKTGASLFLAKLTGLLFFATSIFITYRIGYAMRDRTCGWIAAGIFAFFPCLFHESSIGFMSAFSIPLMAAAVLLVTTQKWWWSIPLIALSAISYPMVAIFSGSLFLLDALANDLGKLKDKELWKSKFIPLFIAAAVCVIILFAGKYGDSSNEFGELVTRSVIQDRVEFTKRGRASIIPVPSFWKQLKNHWGDSFHVVLFLSSFFFLGRRIFKLPRGLYSLLVTSFVLYTVSDILLLKLYFPNRYVRYSLPLFAALCGGFWMSQMIQIEGKRFLSFSTDYLSVKISSAILIGLVLLGAGFYEFNDKLEPGLRTYSYKRGGLHPFIRSLPGKPLLAAHPKLSSEIPVLTGKSVLVATEFSHPWWTLYWEEMSKRTKDFFDAYYATDSQLLRNFITHYQIDYWVIKPSHFKHSYITRRKRLLMEPFNTWVRKQDYPVEHALLIHVPERYVIYKNENYKVIPTDKLLQWLDELEK